VLRGESSFSPKTTIGTDTPGDANIRLFVETGKGVNSKRD